MNSPSDTNDSHTAGSSAAPGDLESSPPSNWREALLGLIASRVALIQLESKEASRQAASRATRLIAVLICAFFAWALLLAGGIACISNAAGLSWYWIAIAASAVHLAVALLLANSAKKPGTRPFPITRAEFQKDREWIENFQKPRKSNV